MASEQYAAIFGRNPALSVAELHALSGQHDFSIKPLGDYAAALDGFDPRVIERAGAITKLVRLNAKTYPDARSALEAEAARVPADSKIDFGVSSYSANDAATPLATNLKRALKERGVRPRFVGQPKGKSGRPVDGELSAVQVRHNQLLSPGADWAVFATADGYRAGRTIWVYDFEGFGARDYEKPAADSRSGMLPPQLARTMVNLATQGNQKLAVYDPFCGMGNLLMESALLGHPTFGSDITPEAVKAAQQNLKWLAEKYPKSAKVAEAEVVVHDATTTLRTGRPAILATEGYLGTPLRASSTAADIDHEAKFVDTMLEKFLTQAAVYLPKKGRLVLTVPAWREPGKRKPRRITTVDQAERLGYAVIRPVPEGFAFPELTARGSIDVARPKQRVIHELFILERT